MDIKLFEGTLLGEIYNFQGPYIPLDGFEPEEGLVVISNEVTELEKAILSLSMSRSKRLKSLISSVMGKEDNNLWSNEEDQILWMGKATEKDVLEKERLEYEIEFYNDVLTGIVGQRCPEVYSAFMFQVTYENVSIVPNN